MYSEGLPHWPDRETILAQQKGHQMRHEPRQETVREKRREPAKPRDPGRARGDGMREAEGRPKDGRTEKGRPAMPKDPGKARGDGMKVAMRGEAGKQSRIPPMKAAKKKVR